MDSEVKQVIVIRKDLGMRKGKMCAQAAHASMMILLDCAFKTFDKRTYMINAHPSEPLHHWLAGLFTKVVVGCDSRDELLDLHVKAVTSKIIRALVKDAGKTEFHGKPTYTALAIGPDWAENIDKITGHLKLL
jgi:PTH2 family peptidyl-tRNA hydrolase